MKATVGFVLVGRIGTKISRPLASFALLLLATAGRLSAQTPAHRPSTGDGFLFGAPTGTVAFRVGYLRANASGDLFDVTQQQFTIGQRGFDAPSLGFDLGFNLSRRLDLGFSVDGTHRSR